MSSKFKVVKEPGEKYRVETPDREKVIGRIKTVPSATHKYQLTEYPRHTMFTRFLHLPTAIQHVIDSHLKGEHKKQKWNWFFGKKGKPIHNHPGYKHINTDGSDSDEHKTHPNIEKTRGTPIPDHEDPHEHIHTAAQNLKNKVWGAASHPKTDQEALLEVSKAHAKFQQTLNHHMPRSKK